MSIPFGSYVWRQSVVAALVDPAYPACLNAPLSLWTGRQWAVRGMKARQGFETGKENEGMISGDVLRTTGLVLGLALTAVADPSGSIGTRCRALISGIAIGLDGPEIANAAFHFTR